MALGAGHTVGLGQEARVKVLMVSGKAVSVTEYPPPPALPGKGARSASLFPL